MNLINSAKRALAAAIGVLKILLSMGKIRRLVKNYVDK